MKSVCIYQRRSAVVSLASVHRERERENRRERKTGTDRKIFASQLARAFASSDGPFARTSSGIGTVLVGCLCDAVRNMRVPASVRCSSSSSSRLRSLGACSAVATTGAAAATTAAVTAAAATAAAVVAAATDTAIDTPLRRDVPTSKSFV